jgi:hypothetical protein
VLRLPTRGRLGGGDLSANRSLSLQYSANLRVNASNQLDTVQDIGTGAQPTFAGLTVGALAGYVKATAGVLSAGAIADADLPATLVRTSRAVNTTAPLTGGGDLSADRTLALSLTANLKVTNGNLDTAQGIQTTSSPSFAGLTVGTLSGVLKATAGAVAGSAVHADLGSIGANDHHNQQHVLAGADHTASGLTTGNALLATGATTFAWGQVDHLNLAHIGSNTHAQLDTALTRLANTSGTNTGDQTLSGLGGVPTSRLVNTTAPLAGGGDLSADRTLTLGVTANLKVTSGNLDTVQAIQTNSNPQFAKLGIGAAVLSGADLSIQDDGSACNVYLLSYNSVSGGVCPGLVGKRARGSVASPSAVLSGDQLLGIGAYGYGTTGFSASTTGGWHFYAAENFSDTACGTYLTFWTTATGTTTAGERCRLSAAGNLLIGTTTDGMTANGSLAVAQDLAHRGTKAGFFNTTPVAKPSALTAQLTTVTFTAPVTANYALTGTAVTNATPWGFATSDDVNTLLSVVANLQARLAAAETNLKNFGLFS